jgi:ABC-type Na+ transport system ATPase subunit NatA
MSINTTQLSRLAFYPGLLVYSPDFSKLAQVTIKALRYYEELGLVKPDSGSIIINGVDAIANPGYAREKCSFQSQTQAPTNGLTPLQAIQLVGKIRRGLSVEVKRRTSELIDSLQMGEWEKTIGLNSTGGVQRLVAFCMAIIVTQILLLVIAFFSPVIYPVE